MRSLAPLGVLGFILAVTSADAATIAGTVKGPDGAPVRGVFVQARQAQLKMTVSVLTDNQGRYVVEPVEQPRKRIDLSFLDGRTAGLKPLKPEDREFDGDVPRLWHLLGIRDE